MKNIDSRNISTERLDLRLPSMDEQHRLWEILCIDEVNELYFPTPGRIYKKYNLLGGSIEEFNEARRIFLSELKDWERQEPFYKAKVDAVKNQDNSQKFTWSIFLKGTNIVIGQITCQPKDNEPDDVRDVGWYIDPAYQGHGYASEAAIAMLDFMFNEVEIREIKTSAADINPGSWKIMEKLGFIYTGDYKSTYIKNNEIVTCKNYYGNKELFNNRLNNIKSNR